MCRGKYPPIDFNSHIETNISCGYSLQYLQILPQFSSPGDKDNCLTPPHLLKWANIRDSPLLFISWSTEQSVGNGDA